MEMFPKEHNVVRLSARTTLRCVMSQIARELRLGGSNAGTESTTQTRNCEFRYSNTDRGVLMALLLLLGLPTTPDEVLDDSPHWSKGTSTHTWHVKSGPDVRRLFALGNEEVAGGPATMRWWGCVKLVDGNRDAAVLLPPGSIHYSRW